MASLLELEMSQQIADACSSWKRHITYNILKGIGQRNSLDFLQTPPGDRRHRRATRLASAEMCQVVSKRTTVSLISEGLHNDTEWTEYENDILDIFRVRLVISVIELFKERLLLLHHSEKEHKSDCRKRQLITD